MPDAVMSEEECIKIGGHCWEQSPWRLASNPPQYERSCKHCGKVQWGQPRPSIEWRNRDA